MLLFCYKDNADLILLRAKQLNRKFTFIIGRYLNCIVHLANAKVLKKERNDKKKK